MAYETGSCSHIGSNITAMAAQQLGFEHVEECEGMCKLFYFFQMSQEIMPLDVRASGRVLTGQGQVREKT